MVMFCKLAGVLVASLLAGGVYKGVNTWNRWEKKKNDPKDCYFDKECHAKVNWDKVGELKDQFFARLKHMKSKGNRDNIKPLWKHFHDQCVQAGMPDDRVDYMLKKWVEYVYPEVLQPEQEEHKKKEVDPKDCYFDKECHAKVNWDKIGEMKKLFFTKLKEMKSKGDKDIKPHWIRMHRGCVAAGMPEDRIDYMLKKWVEYVYPEVWNDPKDCYFDKECHAKVNWDKVGELKEGFFARLKHKKSNGNRDIKPLWKYFHDQCVQAGMPEDRVDYTLKKWVEYVYPEVFEPEKDQKTELGQLASLPENLMEKDKDSDQCSKFKKPMGQRACKVCSMRFPTKVEECMACGKQCKHICMNGDKMDPACFHGEEFQTCHAKCMESDVKVDWDKVKKVKKGIMMRLKVMKNIKKQTVGREFWERAHGALVRTGLPGEKVDMMLKRMAKRAENEEEMVENDECSAYQEKGGMAFKGCQSCAKYYPGQVEKCMQCGRPCNHICPDKTWECYTGKEFGACHKQCMAPSEVIV